MKILLVTMEWPPFKGGVGNYYFNLAKNLTGHEVRVLKVQPNSFYRFFWPQWLKLFFEIRRLIKNNQTDLIWVGQVLPVGNAAYFIKKFFRIPYFVSTHGMDIMLPQRSARKEKVMMKILGQAKFVTANSRFTQKELLNLRLPEAKIEVIYPCPNVQAANQPDSLKIGQIESQLKIAGKRILLTVGRLVKRKGQGLVIEVLPKLLKKFPNLVYLIVGHGPEEDCLKARVKSLGLEQVVIFLGNVSDQDLPAYYQLADVFVMPAVDLAGDVEGFGIVYLEAASFGLPSVAGKSGGMMEAVVDGQTGLLAEPNNYDDLIDKISCLLCDQALYQKIAIKARIRVERDFDWQKQAEKIISRLKKDPA